MERNKISKDVGSDPRKKSTPTSEKKAAPKKAPKKEPKEEEVNIYGNLNTDDYDDDIEDEEDSLDDADEEVYDDPTFFQKFKVAIIGGAALAAGIGGYFIFFAGEEPVVEVAPPLEEPVDPSIAAKDALYQIGIGKEAINEQKIYEQGNLTSEDFRKDFTNQSATETYKEPIEIMSVNDSVSYTKYRSMTDDGVDVYWVDAVYREKNTTFTVPYYIWRTLSDKGVMDVVVETITDADKKVFVSSISARPPASNQVL